MGHRSKMIYLGLKKILCIYICLSLFFIGLFYINLDGIDGLAYATIFIFRSLSSFLYITILPGFLALRTLGEIDENLGIRILYAVCFSSVFWMLNGFALNSFGSLNIIFNSFYIVFIQFLFLLVMILIWNLRGLLQ